MIMNWLRNKAQKEEKRSLNNNNRFMLNAYTGGLFGDSGYDPLAIPAVNQAVQVISSSIASLPITCESSPVINSLLMRPNGTQSAYEFMVIVVRSLLIDGNAFIELQYGANGRLTGFYAHDHRFVSLETVNDAHRYRVSDEFGRQRVLLPFELCHIRYVSNGGVTGETPINRCKMAIDIALGIQVNAKAYQDNGATPTLVLETDQTFGSNMEAFERMRDSWNESHRGSKKRGKVALLELGFRARSLTPDMVQQDFARIYSLFNVDNVGRIFNIPPMMINDLTHGTYTNSAQQAKAFHDQTLRPILQMIESSLSLSLGLPNDRCIQFDTSSMLRMNQSERFTAYETAINAGFMTVDEVRAAEGITGA